MIFLPSKSIPQFLDDLPVPLCDTKPLDMSPVNHAMASGCPNILHHAVIAHEYEAIQHCITATILQIDSRFV